MTDQPQPAALRDAEVIQNVETTLHDLGDWTVGAITAEELIEALAYRGIRLARADAPGVTISVEQARKAASACLSVSITDQNVGAPTAIWMPMRKLATELHTLIDAALADAGDGGELDG